MKKVFNPFDRGPSVSTGSVELFFPSGNTTLDAAPRSAIGTVKMLSVLVLGVLALGILATVLLFKHVGEAQDARAAEASTREFNSLVALQSRQLATHLLDYAHWDEAIASVLVQPDAAWWDSNAGVYALDTFELSFSLALDGQNRTLFFTSQPGQVASAEGLLQEPSLLALMQAARSRPMIGKADTVVANGLVAVDGRLHSVAAVRFRSETRSPSAHPDPEALLIYAQSYTGTVLPVAAEVMGQPQLGLAEGAGAGLLAVGLTLADGRPGGAVTWPAPNPGQQLVSTMVPWLGALFFFVATVIGFAAWRTRRLMHEIVAEERLRESLQLRNRSLMEATGDAIIGVDRAGRVMYLNSVASQAFDVPVPIMLGRDLAEMLPPSALMALQSAVTQGEPCHIETVQIPLRDGHVFPAELSIAPVQREDEIEGAVVVLRDLTHRRAIDAALPPTTQRDALTGAPNRVRFLQLLGGAIEQARTQGATLAVLLLDIDGFKKVNDSIGHEAGDQLLRQAFERLQRAAPDADRVARLGGDEFALLLPHTLDRATTVGLAQAVLDTLGQEFEVQGHSVWTGASMGLALYPQDGQDGPELLRCAEMAMYKAKEQGRNAFWFYDRSMNERIQSSRSMEVSLRQSMARNDLRLHYQPIVNLKTQRLSHMEALVRWHDPERGLVQPDAFIPLAEETGLIVDIGAWVLDQGCQQLALWRTQGMHPNVGLAINVSGRQVPKGLAVDRVKAILAKHDLPARLLSFEITESVLLGRSEPVSHWLDEMRALGIKLMIDDFGTGYSSLSYIKHIKANALKIDKGFIAGVLDHRDDESLVRAILAMAHSLRLSVVAEGVETQEQWDWLKDQGCDYAQGYFLGRPAPAEALQKWIKPD